MRSDFYVYALLDPRKPGIYEYGPIRFAHEPFYVGKGKGTRDRSHFRLGDLSAESKKIRSPFKRNKIRKILESGQQPITIRIKNNVTEDRAFSYEIRAIELIGRKCDGGPLTNATAGGEGISGYTHADNAKQKISAYMRNWHASLSGEQKAKLRKAKSDGFLRFLDTCSPEQRAERSRLISEGHKSRTEEEQAALIKHFRQVQLNLPETVVQQKNKRTSKGLKAYYSSLGQEQKDALSESYSNGQRRYWSDISKEDKAKRTEAIRAGRHANRSEKDAKKTNAKIASSVALQHAKQTPFDRNIRSFMVMCGVMLKNANVSDVRLKEKLRRSAQRFYSNESNLERKPTELREKVRAIIAEYVKA